MAKTGSVGWRDLEGKKDGKRKERGAYFSQFNLADTSTVFSSCVLNERSANQRTFRRTKKKRKLRKTIAKLLLRAKPLLYCLYILFVSSNTASFAPVVPLPPPAEKAN